MGTANWLIGRLKCFAAKTHEASKLAVYHFHLLCYTHTHTHIHTPMFPFPVILGLLFLCVVLGKLDPSSLSFLMASRMGRWVGKWEAGFFHTTPSMINILTSSSLSFPCLCVYVYVYVCLG